MWDGKKYHLVKPLRWAGRAIATISVVFFVVVGIGSAVSEGIGSMTIAGATLGLIVVIAVAGCVASWWRYIVAGILLVCTSIGLGVHIGYFAGHSHVRAWSIIGLPYLVAGTLILSSWWLSRQRT